MMSLIYQDRDKVSCRMCVLKTKLKSRGGICCTRKLVEMDSGKLPSPFLYTMKQVMDVSKMRRLLLVNVIIFQNQSNDLFTGGIC